MKTIEQSKIIYERSAKHINDKYRKITETVNNKGEITLEFHNIEPDELFIIKANSKYAIRIIDSYKYRTQYFIDTLYLNKIMTKENTSIGLISFVFSDNRGNKTNNLNVVMLNKKYQIANLSCNSNRLLVFGSNKADIIAGSKQDDIIYGYGGSDNIDGGDGRDTIDGGDGDDSIFGGKGSDTINGGEGHDVINGGKGADGISGGEGRDHLTGGDQIDYIEGNEDNDYISGDGGDDQLYGGAGNDLIFGGNGNDRLDGDTDHLGQERHNTIGNDHIFSGKGDDVIIAGKGNDYLDGGEGSDIYHFSIGDGANIINETSENNNRLHFDEHFFYELDITRHGSHMLITSKIKGDNLRVLVKDQLGEDGPKIKWLVTKTHPGRTEPVFRIEIPAIFAGRTPDLGDITDPAIADMLKNERTYGINKVISVFFPEKPGISTEDGISMLTEVISMQEKYELAGYSEFEILPKNVTHYVTSLINR